MEEGRRPGALRIGALIGAVGVCLMLAIPAFPLVAAQAAPGVASSPAAHVAPSIVSSPAAHVAPNVAPDAATPATLQARYTFDTDSPTTTTVIDSSGNGHNGTRGSGTSIVSPGATAGDPQALMVPGNAITGFVDIPGLVVDTAQSFSVAADVSVTAVGGNYQTFASIDGQNVSGFFLQLRGQNSSCPSGAPAHPFSFSQIATDSTANPTTISACSTFQPAPNTYYHLVGVYDGTDHQLRLYVNGQLQAATPFSGGFKATGDTVIGRGKYNTPGDPVTGEIDEVNFFSGVLTEAQVAQLAGTTAATPATQKAYYPFDEGQGKTANDVSGNGNTGTLQGTAAYTSPGQPTNNDPFALSVTGSPGSYVDVTNTVVDTARSFSVAAWVNLNVVGGFQTFASIDGQNVSGFFLQDRGNQSSCPTGNGAPANPFSFSQLPTDNSGATTNSACSSTQPVANTWYHLVGVYDGTAHQLRLYVNGVLQAATTFGGGFTANGHTVIGRGKFNNPGDYANGKIDDAHFYQGVLSQAQIDALANGNPQPPTISVALPPTLTTGASPISFTGTISNPAGGSSYSNARGNFTLSGIPGLMASQVHLFYNTGNGYAPVPLSGTGVITGYFGPFTGFPVGPGYNVTTPFSVSIDAGAPTGTLSVTTTLDEVNGTSGAFSDTLTMTNGTVTVIPGPTISVALPSTLIAGNLVFTPFTGTITNPSNGGT